MTTDIVILNYNGRKLLESYLPSVLASVEGMQGVRVVVADNASTDGSAEFMAEKYPDVPYIQLSRNYGFAEGYNRALNQLQADCFVLLNSDIEVPDDWFAPLQEWMEFHPDCGICGPKLHQIYERDRFEYAGAAGGYIDRLGFPFCRGRVMKITEKDEGQYDIPAEVMWVSGAALMIRSKVWFSSGGFCAGFFAHMEEIDLCWRVRLEGWKVNVVPRSTVFHLGGASLPQDSPYKLFLNYRNNLLMLSRVLPQTLAVDFIFNILGRIADPDEGPDMFGNCCDVYNESDKKLKQDLVITSCSLAIDRAKSIIRRRMFVDDIAAAVYLFSGKKEFHDAVHKAHREFRTLRKDMNERKLRHYIEDIISGDSLDIARNILTDEPGSGNWLAGTFALKGIWKKWSVWQYLLRKSKIFAEIKNLI